MYKRHVPIMRKLGATLHVIAHAWDYAVAEWVADDDVDVDEATQKAEDALWEEKYAARYWTFMDEYAADCDRLAGELAAKTGNKI